MKWLKKYVFFNRANRIHIAANTTMDGCCPKVCVYKYELCMPSNSKVMQVFLCCHGKRASMATNHIMDCCYPQRTCVPNIKFKNH